MFRAIALAAVLVTGPAWAGPSFEAFPAEPYLGKVHAPVLDTADKRMYRTRITEAAKGQPNFAGRYIVARWGCGTSCQVGAVIDARSGDVVFFPWSVCCNDNYDAQTVEFRTDSSLFIARGLLNETGDNKTHYFDFDGTAFKPVD